MNHHPALDALAIAILLTATVVVLRILLNPTRGYRPSPRTYPGPCTYCGATVKFKGARRGWKCQRCGRGLPGIFELLCR